MFFYNYKKKYAGDFIFLSEDAKFRELLKLNTMQLETPGSNHCCLMANDVQNER